MKKILFTVCCLLFFLCGCAKEKDTFTKIDIDTATDMIVNKSTFVMLLGSEDCYSCDMLKDDIREDIEKNDITVYEVDALETSNSTLNQISITTGDYESLPVLLFVVKGEVPIGNKYEYTLKPEGWRTWLINMKLIQE